MIDEPTPGSAGQNIGPNPGTAPQDSTYPPYPNPPYVTTQNGVGSFDLAAEHLVATPEETQNLIDRWQNLPNFKKTGLTLKAVPMGTGHFSYDLLPNDPRVPLAIVDDKGNTWADYAGQVIWSMNQRGVGYPGHWVFSDVQQGTNLKFKSPQFQWIWDPANPVSPANLVNEVAFHKLNSSIQSFKSSKTLLLNSDDRAALEDISLQSQALVGQVEAASTAPKVEMSQDVLPKKSLLQRVETKLHL